MEIIFILILVVIVSLSFKQLLKQKEEKIEKEDELKEKGTNYNSTFSTEINHICGLPLTENSKCILHLCDEQIVVESSGNIFKLSKDRIIDMNIKTSKEVQNSISGAVGGYMLLGPLGAFLGASSTDFHRFFIIIYKNKEDKETCISFDMKDDLKILKQIYNYIKNFNANITNKKEIEL